MKPILLISFSDGSYSPTQNAFAQCAAEALQKFRPSKRAKIIVEGASIYETGLTAKQHTIAHAFLYGYWARKEDTKPVLEEAAPHSVQATGLKCHVCGGFDMKDSVCSNCGTVAKVLEAK